MELKVISILEYINLEDKAYYDIWLRHSKLCKLAIDFFNIKDLTKKTFDNVKDLQYLFSKENYTYTELIELISEIANVKIENVTSLNLLHFKQFVNYLIQENNRIIEIEKNLLGSEEPTDLQKMAGIDKFSKYGIFIQYDKLSGGCIEKFKIIGQIQYDVCLTKLALEKDTHEYLTAYSELINKK